MNDINRIAVALEKIVILLGIKIEHDLPASTELFKHVHKTINQHNEMVTRNNEDIY